MKLLLNLLLLLGLLAACKPTQPAQGTNPSGDIIQADSSTILKEERSAAIGEDKKLEQRKNKSIVAIFEDCVVYAGATDFVFETLEGEQIMIRDANLPEEQKLKIAYLIDDAKNLEGPPAGNPKWIGKKFNLNFDAEGEIVSVTLIR